MIGIHYTEGWKYDCTVTVHTVTAVLLLLVLLLQLLVVLVVVESELPTLLVLTSNSVECIVKAGGS